MTDLNEIKEIVKELLDKMTMAVFNISATSSLLQNKSGEFKDDKELIDVNITIKDPQILIGQSGQNLFELERILRIILSKKLQKEFYLTLDINDYKKKKIEYLRNLAKDAAAQVYLTKEKKILPPMLSYERRIIHMELAGRQDIITESQGEGSNRYIVISPR